jgi:hypothetical protein
LRIIEILAGNAGLQLQFANLGANLAFPDSPTIAGGLQDSINAFPHLFRGNVELV